MAKKIRSWFKHLFHIFAFRYLWLHGLQYNPSLHIISLYAGPEYAHITFYFGLMDNSKYLVNFKGDKIVSDKRAMKRIIKFMGQNQLPRRDIDAELDWFYKNYAKFNYRDPRSPAARFKNLEYVRPDSWAFKFYPN